MNTPRWTVLPGAREIPPTSTVGGKAHNLARLAAVSGARVPPWFALGVSAFEEMVLPAWRARGERGAREVLGGVTLTDELRRELLAALSARGLLGATLAVRSSATAEDAEAASFAGQFSTVLGVPAREDLAALWDAIREVWRSAFSAHATAYAEARDTTVRMAVLIQELVPARAAGVAFSVDPVTGDRTTAVVSAVYGLGELLVSGESDADTFRIAGGGQIAEVVAEKRAALLRTAEGAVTRVAVPDALTRTACISRDQAADIGRLARELERSLGVPQDIEWALAPASGDAPTDPPLVLPPSASDQLFLLQARPVTALAAPKPRGEHRIWDNSNIVESYSGVTTPLTFSFARGVYEQVYRQFCDVLGVRAPLIESQRHVFANMLGLTRGRVYYHLLNWYRVLALLPGYALNRQFMERMMGVREALTDPPPPPGAGERWRDALRLLRMGWRLWREHRLLEERVADFHARVDRTLAPLEKASLGDWDADRLVALYRQLEDALLLHWRPPLVNDFFAMIWFGILGRLTERWLPGTAPTLVNDLLVGEGGIISTEPARRIMALAKSATADPALRPLFATETDDATLLRTIRTSPRFASFSVEVNAYLAKFGDRCVGELKLETIPPTEDPAFVIRMVRAYVAQGRTGATDSTREVAIRAAAEREVRGRLSALRRMIFFFVLGHARARIRGRENLRFERTRVFGAVRRIFVALGRRFHADGLLTDPRQVFHLTVEEVFGAVAGTNASGDLTRLATERIAEFARYESEPAPPDRFETWGPPTASMATQAGTADASARGAGVASGAPDATDRTLRGLGCCPGIVRAPVRVVRDPSRAGDLSGHILVAERTDPGWTLLFPTASGLLVQRGSLLSHSAIVAREIGLACIVAIPQLMDALRDGEIVEMDGATGIVRRIDA